MLHKQLAYSNQPTYIMQKAPYKVIKTNYIWGYPGPAWYQCTAKDKSDISRLQNVLVCGPVDWLQSLKQFFINVASLTLMALF